MLDHLFGSADPITFVSSKNLQRRHLTTAKREIVGVKVERVEAMTAR